MSCRSPVARLWWYSLQKKTKLARKKTKKGGESPRVVMPSRMNDHPSLDLLRVYIGLMLSMKRCELMSADEEPTPPEIDHKTLLLCNCVPRSDKTIKYSETRQLKYAMRYLKEVAEGARSPPSKAEWRRFAQLLVKCVDDKMDVKCFDDVSDMDGDDSDAEEAEVEVEVEVEEEEEEKEEEEEEEEGEEEEGEEEEEEYEPTAEAGEEDEEDEEEGEEEGEEDDEEESAPSAKRQRM